MKYTIDDLTKEFKDQADRYDKWYDECIKRYPENYTEQNKFNLPQALYVITSEIKKLQDAYHGTQKPD